jgi:hypothetical protein
VKANQKGLLFIGELSPTIMLHINASQWQGQSNGLGFLSASERGNLSGHICYTNMGSENDNVKATIAIKPKNYVSSLY